VKTPVVGVVAPTVPFMFIEAVPVRFVTVPEDGVPIGQPPYNKVPVASGKVTVLLSVTAEVKVSTLAVVLPPTENTTRLVPSVSSSIMKVLSVNSVVEAAEPHANIDGSCPLKSMFSINVRA
jgi:hypothetical protein